MQSDQEKIRLKRLAKMQSTESSPVEESGGAHTKPQVNAGLSSQLQQNNQQKSHPSLTGLVQSKASPTPSKVLTEEEEMNLMFEEVLKVTLNGDNDQRQRPQYQFLQDLKQELSDESQELLITVRIFDRVLLSVLSTGCIGAGCVEYLLTSFNQCIEQCKFIKKQYMIDGVKELQKLLVSYTGLLLQYPDTFPQDQQFVDQGYSVIVPWLTADNQSSKYLDDQFFQMLIERFTGDGLEEIIGGVVASLSVEINQKIISDNFLPLVNALQRLVFFKEIAVVINQMDSFLPDNVTQPREFESVSILGPFLKVSTFGLDNVQFAMNLFGNEMVRTRSNVDAANTSFRLTWNSYINQMYQIVFQLIKSGPECRDRVLQYFATVLKLNENRGKMHIQDPKTVSTEGFMCNIYAILLKLSDPLMDTMYSKLHLIDPEYLRKSRRIDVSKLTKLSSKSPDEEQKWFSSSGEGSNSSVNFVTEIFYLTEAFAHFGLNRSILTYLDILKHLKEAIKALEQLNREQQSVQSGPRAQMQQMLLKRTQSQVDQLNAIKLTFDILLLDQNFLAHALSFQQLVMRFLLRLATSPSAGVLQSDQNFGKGPQFRLEQHGVSLPLSKAPPKAFSLLPEYFVEDGMELLLQVGRFQPEILLQSGQSLIDEVAGFVVTFLSSRQVQAPQNQQQQQQQPSGDDMDISSPAEQQQQSGGEIFIKNPYLAAKMVEVLFTFTWEYGPGGAALESLCQSIFGSHPLLQQYLPAALISFYVEIEKTGVSSQFYDKFGIRYNISQILKLLWTKFGSAYRPKLKEESVKRWDVFVRFVNLLMNDTTYLLDEGLGKLTQIHTLQLEMADPAFGQLNDQQRAEKEKQMSDLERGAGSCIQLANETVHMLSYLTDGIYEPFLRPEVIDRLAAMLNYNLVILVGPKCTELKVQNPEKYSFKPRILLSEIIDIYLHLSREKTGLKDFVQAVTRDGRSYNKMYFEKAAHILQSKAVKSMDEVGKLSKFVQDCEQVKAEDQQEEEDLGEVPDEYLDPLMFSLMEDPVILPTSKITVDRSTITSHLLSDSTDPFNRRPLSIDMVQPNEELRAQIQSWKLSKKRK
ncbi:hypothetical protein MIR68_004978 [Amoeboaphelidium protococcarum]|nr:hypothetical protein MIR68_004978 [Amoeboaphelidium protococcarum]